MNKLAEKQEEFRAHDAAQAPADPYAWWRRALAGGKIGSKELPVSDGAPQCGFYRMRKSTGHRGMGGGVAPKIMVPVAIFEHEGEIVALVDGKVSDVDRAWLYCAKHPVTEEAYRQAVETGQWSDVAEGVGIVAPPAPIGHNAPADESESMKDQIEAAKADLDGYAEIKGDEHAAKAQTLRSRLLELAREADKKRDAEKRPHLEAGKAVDARYMPLVRDAKAAADKIAKALSAFFTKRAREEEEERRKEEAAQRAAAEAAAKQGKPAPEPEPPAPKPQPTQVKGGYGRAATIKAVNVVTEVTDRPSTASSRPIPNSRTSCSSWLSAPSMRAMMFPGSMSKPSERSRSHE